MITFEQLEAEVRRIAAESPDYSYPPKASQIGCVYNETTDFGDVEDVFLPACIFGRAFSNLGFPVPDEWNFGTGIDDILDYMNISHTHSQKAWAVVAQAQQDNSQPYSEVIVCADTAVHDA